jgi:hypothetical protein
MKKVKTSLNDRRMREEPEIFFEELNKEPSPVYCSHFGCGMILTLEEQLCGNKCLPHSMQKKTDIMLIIKWPDGD